MIRIDLVEEIDRAGDHRRGIWHWRCEALSGFSRQPLLDACRELQRIGANPAERAGLFREGKNVPDLWCRIDVGARTTVDEAGPWFAKFKPFDPQLRNRA
ncbi:hypothetical protein CQ14_06745 [Bradyrhizobium lablabi]|uniref:Uncharacterized protein n=1 Tax=Bradyrhizobium lablabi TaxID=722472 RepID=A0A0R3MU59_9BRAD|nr:hypothetical protein [Bradyrhizobium lablabi]KRR21341.1 hypothetical protein CQ14_06745 [Bradyrhizobium lablabi]